MSWVAMWLLANITVVHIGGLCTSKISTVSRFPEFLGPLLIKFLGFFSFEKNG